MTDDELRDLSDEELDDEQLRREGLKLEPEHRARLVRALVETDAVGQAVDPSVVEAWVEATSASTPPTDDDVVQFVDRKLREQADMLVRVKQPLRDMLDWRDIATTAVVAIRDRTKAATDAVQTSRTRNVERARVLRVEGKSIAQIALAMNVQPRTVERYLQSPKTPTDRRSVRPSDELPG